MLAAAWAGGFEGRVIAESTRRTTLSTAMSTSASVSGRSNAPSTMHCLTAAPAVSMI